MFISRWMNKEVVVHIHNGILISYKMEHIWVSSSEVDDPGAYYTEWSKSEKEREILYIITYTWNLERWYQRSYMQGSKGDRCKEQLLGLSGRRRGWDDLREYHWNMYITIIKIDDHSKFHAWSRVPKAGALGQPRGRGWGGRGEEGSEWGGHMYPYGQFMVMYDKNITIV